jgi:hypothetical protein
MPKILRVRAKIKFHFQVLRRLPGKAPKRWNIEIFPRLGNAARQDASAHKNVMLFFREPLVLTITCSIDIEIDTQISVCHTRGCKKQIPVFVLKEKAALDVGLRGECVRPGCPEGVPWRFDAASHYFALVMLAICLILLFLILKSPFGTTFRAVRDNPERCAAVGINVRRHQLIGIATFLPESLACCSSWWNGRCFRTCCSGCWPSKSLSCVFSAAGSHLSAPCSVRPLPFRRGTYCPFAAYEICRRGIAPSFQIAIALGNEPRLLVPDEPTAGRSPEKTRTTMALIRHLADSHGLTILFCKHDMEVVFNVAQQIMVMRHGEILVAWTHRKR